MKFRGQWLVLVVSGFGGGLASAASPSQIEFFESRIRPILAQECYECHSEATKSKGGLLLDTRKGWQTGGDSGAAVIVPGKPEESLLLQSIHHTIEDLQMPKAGAKLEDSVLADFEKWIADGAVDPRDEPPSAEQLAEDTDWEAIRERREGWWSFQPIQVEEPPVISGVDHTVDRFIRQGLVDAGLKPSPRAEPRTLHRRLNFALIGLPPTLEESEAFLAEWKNDPDKAVKTVVNRLIDDPRFGEKWARHWMDWLRYTDSHGSEGDPTIPHAWRYRDYLIRALNADVPYDQMILEHIAGDLLEEPRINSDLQINESAIGPAHFRMVFHGFAPTDALDERVRFTDDQINVVTKAFMGLTVSCARCHDHKFDAISQADYYALFGIFTSSLPATVAVDAPGVLDSKNESLADLKPKVRQAIGEVWLKAIEEDSLNWSFDHSGTEKSPALSLLQRLSEAEGVAETWERSRRQHEEGSRRMEELRSGESLRLRWDMSDSDETATWTRMGEGLPDEKPSKAGEFSLGVGDRVIEAIYPAGVYSNKLSNRQRAMLASAPFDLDGEYDLYLRVIGDKALSRYVVQNYPRRGTVFHATDVNDGRWDWVSFKKLDYWSGDNIHIELSTAGETAVLVKPGERSWFGIREALLVKKGESGPSATTLESLEPVLEFEGIPGSLEEARERYRLALEKIVERWASGEPISDAEALFLDEMIRAEILPNRLERINDKAARLATNYRELEASVPVPSRAPGLIERTGRDHPLFVRGDHKQPGEIIPRRFLEAIDEAPYETAGSGRLEFAHDLLREDNPFTSRMIVNRVWHHLFGAGLVASADNFGRLGEAPSHPELLDYLAERFRNEQEWSIKDLIRYLVLTETWQQQSAPSEMAIQKDPDNRLLSHASLRRLEAEAIRDSVHFVAGQLDESRYGETVTGNTPRRAIYVRAKRNSLDPFLTTFDFPVPASTVGRRDSTNVPAQSLTLLNDPYLIQQAGAWADRVLKESGENVEEADLIRRFFLMGLNREPTEREMTQAGDFLYAIDAEYRLNEEKLSELEGKMESLREKMISIEEPVRVSLLRERGNKADDSEKLDLKPLAHWNFSEGTKDHVGGLGMELAGSARLEKGALILDGEGFARTEVLSKGLGEKSLEVRVQLDGLDQRAGGVITVQNRAGSIFDAIVFAERKPGHWLVGSNNHRRTLDLEAEAESEASSRIVHLVATFEADGTILFYRDGETWGKPTRKADLQIFEGGDTEVIFGMRHGGRISEGRMLSGKVFSASLYERALTADEVRAAFAQGGAFLSRQELLSALSDEEKTALASLTAEIESLEAERDSLQGEVAKQPQVRQRWQDFAHAMFNLKEFIYLR